MARMVRTETLIKELREINNGFGNTGVYIGGMSWGGMALNEMAEEEKAQEIMTRIEIINRQFNI